MDDSLEQPIVKDGMMLPLSDEPGFGCLVDRKWIDEQEVTDAEGMLLDL
jgi:hypothetical protein